MKDQKVEIKTYDDLKAVGGDLLKQAEDSAFTLGAQSVDLKLSEQKGAEIERGRIVGLAMAFLGEEDGKQFEHIIASGITVEQYKSVAGERKPKESEKKKEMLDAINNAGADNPGAGGGDRGKKNYFQLVAEIMVERKCSRFEAMKEANRRHPEARTAMLQEANPHLTAAK